MNLSVREKGVFVFGRYRLDPVRRTLFHDGMQVALTARLFDTLHYLVEHHNRLIERDELEQAVWRGRVVEDGNLQKAISALRKALQAQNPAEPPVEPMIATIQGKGFQFIIPVVFEPYAPDVDTAILPQDAAIPVSLSQTGSRARRRLAGWAAASLVMAMAVSAAVWRLSVPPRLTGAATEQAFTPPPHSVAIMAFANLSGDPAQAYFSDGLAEELMDSLGRIAVLRVAALQSSFAFKDKPASIAQIARALNVGAILEGSVRRDHATLRISAQLIDAATGYQLWSGQYDHAEDDLLKVQGDIAKAIAASLQIKLAADDVVNLTRGGSANTGAFSAYLRGMQQIRRLDRSAFPDALAAFDTALATDPTFALAYTGRAIALLDIAYDKGDMEAAPRRRMLELALAAAEHAIALEPRLPEGYAARALILYYGLLDPAGAAADATSAAALEPNNLQSQCVLAEVLMEVGRSSEAIKAGQRATELDPYSPVSWEVLGYVLYEAHRPDQALAALDHVAALAGQLPPMAAGVLAYTELTRGHADAAGRTCPSIGAGSRRAMCLAIADNALGRTQDARAQFDLVQTAPSYTHYDGAVIYAQWGNTAEALGELEAAYAARDPKLGQIGADPLLDPLRSLTAFQDIARRVAHAAKAAGTDAHG